jgi:polyphosphate kinase
VRTKLAFLLAALALVAGCGGGSSRLTKAEFEQHIQKDGNVLQKAITKLSAAKSLTQLATEVGAAETAVKAAADDLDSVNPPADAETPTKTIVKALRSIDAQLKLLEQAAKDKDLLAVQKTAQTIQKSPEIAAAQVAAKELQKKGYKIGVIGQ